MARYGRHSNPGQLTWLNVTICIVLVYPVVIVSGALIFLATERPLMRMRRESRPAPREEASIVQPLPDPRQSVPVPQSEA